MTVLARTTDPVTSHEAAAFMEPHAKGQKALILMYVKRHPGLTASEYGELVGMDRVRVGKRLPDLMRDGEVVQGEPRLAKGCKVREVTWWIPEQQGQLL